MKPCNIVFLFLMFGYSYGFDFTVRQRLDGWYNNLQHPSWGSADSRFGRLSPSAYADGVYQIPGENRPNPYLVSDSIFKGKDGLRNERNLTALFAFFGQVVAYEIMMTNQYSCPIESYTIPVKMCENATFCHLMNMPFSRAEYDKETGSSPNSPREQINKVTSWIDGSYIYSTKMAWTQALRNWDNGTLATTSNGQFPQQNWMGIPMFNLYSPTAHNISAKDIFVLGDPRVNENPGLLLFAIVFMRWHNVIAKVIQSQHPDWFDEEIFSASRRWVIATLQNIVAYEYLPALLGEPLAPYKGYNPNLYPAISEEFQSAAFRYGHSLIPPGIYLRDAKCNFRTFPPLDKGSNVTLTRSASTDKTSKPARRSINKSRTRKQAPTTSKDKRRIALRLCNSWWDAQSSMEMYGIEEMIMGLASQMAEMDDHYLISDLRERLFGPRQFSRQDLIVLNIMRGRDKGIPDYNTVRRSVSLPEIEKWRDINPSLFSTNPELFDALADLYDDDINNVDFYPAGLLETDPLDGPGPTFKKIIKEQFETLRDSDRFWFENEESGIFTRDEISFVRGIGLHDILINVTNIPPGAIQTDVFHWTSGNPCPQPKQIETDEEVGDVDRCGFVQTYDFFESSFGSYVATCAALLISPLVCGFVAYLVVKTQSQRKKLLLEITSTLTRDSKKKSNPTSRKSTSVAQQNIEKPKPNFACVNPGYESADEKTKDSKSNGRVDSVGNGKTGSNHHLSPFKRKFGGGSASYLGLDTSQKLNVSRFSLASIYSNIHSLPKNIISGYEWLNSNHRRKVYIDLSSSYSTYDKDSIVILNRKGVKLKSSDFAHEAPIVYVEVNGTGGISDSNGVSSANNLNVPPYLVLIKSFDKFDLVLEFGTAETRDLFACVKLVNYAQRIGKSVHIQYTNFNEIFEHAQTKEKKQKQLDHFFRKAYSAIFKPLDQVLDVPAAANDEGEDIVITKPNQNKKGQEVLSMKLNKFEFAEALGMKPSSLFVERMFAVIDKDDSGSISFQEFLNLTYIFANGTPEEKLKIIFDMFDVNHREQITLQEFCSILKGFIDCDKTNDAELESCVDDMLTKISPEQKRNRLITRQDFCDLMLQHGNEWARCGIHLKGAGKVYAKKTGENRHESFSLDESAIEMPKNWYSKAYGAVLAYFEENRQNIFYLIIFYAIVVALFAEKMLRFCLLLEHTDLRRVMGAGICLTRASANVISFVYCLMLITVCRHLITKLRETKIKKYVPLDSALTLHKLCAYTGIVMVVLHCGGHLVNFYHISTQPLEYLKCLFKEMFYKDSNMPPNFVFWAFKTITGLTGIILTLITVVMYVFAHNIVRKQAYRYFWNTHKLFVPFYALNILHGASRLTSSPSFHLYLIVPAILYTIDKLISLTRKHLEMTVIKANLLPSDVTKLVFNRPHAFTYKSGQWVQISIPDINPNEYHAFTLTSAPYEDVLSVHVKALGRWTWKVRNLYDPNNTYSSNYPRVYIDGPYGDGNQDWPNYEVVIMFGGGIGVTPYASILKDLVANIYQNQQHTILCKKVYFMWICPSHKSFEWFVTLLQEIKEKDKDDVIDIHICITQYFDKYDLRTTMLYICDKYFRNITNKSILTGLKATNHFGRPEFGKILRFIQGKHRSCKKIGVFSCGPPPLTNAIERSCDKINKLREQPPLVSHFENFG